MLGKRIEPAGKEVLCYGLTQRGRKRRKMEIQFNGDTSYPAFISPSRENICWNFPKYWKMSPVSWGVKTGVTPVGESEDGWRQEYGGFAFVFRANGRDLPHFMVEKMTIGGKAIPEFSYEEFIALREEIKKGEAAG